MFLCNINKYHVDHGNGKVVILSLICLNFFLDSSFNLKKVTNDLVNIQNLYLLKMCMFREYFL